MVKILAIFVYCNKKSLLNFLMQTKRPRGTTWKEVIDNDWFWNFWWMIWMYQTYHKVSKKIEWTIVIPRNTVDNKHIKYYIFISNFWFYHLGYLSFRGMRGPIGLAGPQGERGANGLPGQCIRITISFHFLL